MEAAGTETEKLGLALSGGGFRAAFFHVGVLARLAELEILPEVEVISTVSGGSIVGALYYVCLKRRLEKAGGAGLDRDEYLDLVAEVECRLRTGAQKDIRTRIFANPLKNAKMVLWPRYSRSDRIGDLYDRYLYKRAWGGSLTGKWMGHGPQKQIELRDLEGRGVSLPSLFLNATSLNSGHNWRFEASRMGESLPEDARRSEIVPAIDKNMWLKPGYFEPSTEHRNPVPPNQLDFPLALAVAASAAVPGVFQPLAISNMYEGIRVQLVDGGTQDNQGLQGLLDSGCKRLIVSDASGQMEDVNSPSARILGVLGRSASIEGDRIRDEQLLEVLDGGREQCALMHLRRGIVRRAVLPIESPPEARTDLPSAGDSGEFGVHRDVQEALSRIRTDLDFFSDTEASALELDGYLMSGVALPEGGFAARDDVEVRQKMDWSFREEGLEPELAAEDPLVLAQLEAGSHKFIRSFWLHRTRTVTIATAIAVALLAGIHRAWHDIADLLNNRWPAWAVLAGLVVLALLAVLYCLDPRSKPARIAIAPPMFLVSLPVALMAAVAAIPIFAVVHLLKWARALP